MPCDQHARHFAYSATSFLDYADFGNKSNQRESRRVLPFITGGYSRICDFNDINIGAGIVVNHANFDAPELIVFSGSDIAGSAGVIRGTASRERQIQFALRLEF
jgi:hypothetical protein